jgi:transcriptional regulator with XRE-family HTH domain
VADKDLQQLRQVLREAVRASKMPVREMERQLGIGHGALYRILDGELDLRVRHLLALAGLLGVPPTDFFELGCPDAMTRANRRLSDWIGQPSGGAAAQAAASLPLDELRELIRTTVREELEQQSASPAPSRRTRR